MSIIRPLRYSMFRCICIKLCLLMSTLEAIDDLLPFDDSGRPVGISSGLKAVAWPALIEKAVCCHHAHMT